MRKAVLFSFLIIILSVMFTEEVESQTIAEYQGDFVEEWIPKSFSGFSEVKDYTIPPEQADVTVNVDPASVVAKIPATIFGYSITYYGGNDPTQNSDAMRYYQALNSPALRFPGGTPSDCYFWDATNENDFPDWYEPGSIRETNWRGDNVEVTPLHSEIDWGASSIQLSEFYQLLEENPSMNAVMQVNYSAAIFAHFPTREERVLAAAQYAAEWVRDANINRGLDIKYWEIGNEIGRPWTPTGGKVNPQTGYPDPSLGQHIVYGEEYAEDFVVFAREMKKVDPSIKVGACGDFNDNFTYDCMQNPEFVEACDWMGVHDYYGTWDASHSEAELKSQADMVQETADRYRNIFQNAGYAKDVIPLALTEWNTASVGNYATLSMGGAILHAKAVGKEIEAGYGMINMFAMSDVWRNKGDLGLISNWSSSAPKENGFDEPTYPEGTPSPVFYPYAYYAKTFGDKLIQSNSSDQDVRAYSSVFTNSPHATTTVLINETNQSKIAEINTGGQPQNFYFYEISPVDQNNFFSTQIEVNGVGNENDSFVGGPLNFEDIPPYAASAQNGIKLEMKPYSIYFVVVSEEQPVLSGIRIKEFQQRLTLNEPFQFEIEYLDQNGNPVAGDETPHFEVTGGGTLESSGIFTPSRTGLYEVSATVTDDEGNIFQTAPFEFGVTNQTSTLISNSELGGMLTLLGTEWTSFSNSNSIVSTPSMIATGAAGTPHGAYVDYSLIEEGSQCDEWQTGTQYLVGTTVTHNGDSYTAIHQYNSDVEPGVGNDWDWNWAWESGGECGSGEVPNAGFGFNFYQDGSAFDLDGSDGISFWHKGNTCNFRVDLTSGQYLQMDVVAHNDWTKVSVNWSDFTTTPVLTNVRGFSWAVENVDGTSGDLFIDEVIVEGLAFNTPLPPKYQINLLEVENGTADLTTDPAFDIPEGEEVIVLVNNIEVGKEVHDVIVKDSGGNTVDVSNSSFTMPGGDVDVSVLLGTATNVSRIDETSEGIRVFPNPVSNELNIIFKEDGVKFYSLLNMKEQVVKTGCFESDSKKLDVSNLKPGVFILKVKSDNELYKRTVVVN